MIEHTESEGTLSETEAPFYQFLTVILRHRRSVILIPLTALLATVGFSLLQARTYSSSASFLPQSTESSASGLASVAVQLGISVSGGRASQSPAFYADLLRTSEILDSAVNTTYAFASRGQSYRGTLVDLFDIDEDDQAARHALATRTLNEALGVTTSRETGVVRVSVTTKWPELSRQVVERLLAQINTFNVERLQSQATAERKFTEDRLNIVRTELLDAETRLRDFLQRNRQFTTSSDLQFEHDRLDREVQMRQQIFTSLTQAHEQARIDEVRNIPVITVLERPSLPIWPDTRGTIFKGLLALVLGAALAILLAFSRDFVERSRATYHAEYSDFASLRAEAWDDIRHPWRLVRGNATRR